MKSFPSAFEAEKNKKTGAAPTWILKLTVDSVDYYLSDNAYTITPWSVTTKAWVSAWGELAQGVSGAIGEYQVADMSVSCLIDPDAYPNIETLAESDIEESSVELYLWFHGLSDAPQIMYTGYVRDVEQTSNTSITLTMQDESITFAKSYVGTIADQETHPEIDPDDVGKVEPIIYGTVERVPALAVVSGAVTSIYNAITATQTSFYVSDGSRLESGDTIQIDEENIYIIAITDDEITSCTRGYNSTSATIHSRGALVIELKEYSYYLLAGHEVDSVDKLTGRVGQAELDISDIATIYPSGTTGYTGKAIAKIPGVITVQQAVDLLVNDGISVSDAISIVDSIAVDDTISVSDTIALSNGDHSHSTDIISSSAQYGNALPQSNSGSDDVVIIPSWPSLLGTPLEITYQFICDVTSDNSSIQKSLYIWTDPSTKVLIESNLGAKTDITWVGTISSYTSGYPRLELERDGLTTTIYLTLTNCQRSVVYDGSIDNTVVSKTGTASKTGSASKAGTVDRSGSVTKLGTVTVSGNSTANTLIADYVFADMTRSFATPLDAIESLLTVDIDTPTGKAVTVEQFGTLPAGYALNGAITEYKTVLEWVNIMAFQLRSFIRFFDGKAQLFVRPDSISSDKTISSISIDDTGRLQWGRVKSSIDDVVNVINLQYDRDWTNVGEYPYREMVSSEDTDSQDVFGVCERPELFNFDFVTSSAMADSLLLFYLTYYKVRHWRHTFSTFLDNCELEFMDGVTQSFKGGDIAELREVRYNPGNYQQIDSITYVSEV